MQIRVQNGINPLIIVNGQEIGHGIGLLNNILVDEVETLESLSEDEAVAKYGVKGKDGAYVVTTKKKLNNLKRTEVLKNNRYHCIKLKFKEN